MEQNNNIEPTELEKRIGLICQLGGLLSVIIIALIPDVAYKNSLFLGAFFDFRYLALAFIPVFLIYLSPASVLKKNIKKNSTIEEIKKIKLAVISLLIIIVLVANFTTITDLISANYEEKIISFNSMDIDGKGEDAVAYFVTENKEKFDSGVSRLYNLEKGSKYKITYLKTSKKIIHLE